MVFSTMKNLQMKKRFTEEQIVGILREAERLGRQATKQAREARQRQWIALSWFRSSSMDHVPGV